MSTVMTGEELDRYLSTYTGTEAYYRNWLGLLYTDGIKALAREAGAYWLIDAIGSHALTEGRRGRYPFQLWTLAVKDQAAVLTMQEDQDQPELVRQEIKYTDFPEGTWKFYLIDGVLILPSEY